jgi:hypothetical protein
MSESCTKQASARHGFVFSSTPTIRGSFYGGSVTLYDPQSYGAILDCVFEMADQVSSGNGVTPQQAIRKVLKDEGWRLIPQHEKEIERRLM